MQHDRPDPLTNGRVERLAASIAATMRRTCVGPKGHLQTQRLLRSVSRPPAGLRSSSNEPPGVRPSTKKLG
jgi:hypothetical protein